MKSTPDNALKNLILTGINEGYQTLPSLREYIRITPFTIDGDEFYYSNESGLSSGINYLKNRGFITIYPKDETGRPIKKPKPTRPYRYFLNDRALQYLNNPNKRIDRDALIAGKAREMATDIIENDERFKEAIERRAREMMPVKIENRIEKPVLKPVNQILKVQMDDGAEKEIELDSNNEIKEVQELKAQLRQLEADHTAVIQEYENYIQDIEYTLSLADIKNAKKVEKYMLREEKIRQRHALAVQYWNNRYFLDEYFFKQWGGEYVIAVLKKLMELGQMIAPECVDIFSRNSDLYKRRTSRIKKIINGKDIIGCEFYIKKFTDSGVVIDSQYLEAEKTLKW